MNNVLEDYINAMTGKETGATNNGKDHLLLFVYCERMLCYLENRRYILSFKKIVFPSFGY